jgi:Tol biopolymer transport system component
VIAVTDAVGADARVVTPCAGDFWDPQWLADGTRIAFTANLGVRPVPDKRSVDNVTVTMRGDGLDPVVLAHDVYSVAASARSRLVAVQHLDFAAVDPNRKLAVFDSASGSERPLGDLAGPNHGGLTDMSADDRELVFFDTGVIHVVNTDGSGMRDLAVGTDATYGPRWSPNGTRILYEKMQGDGHEIFSVDPDGSDVRNLTDTPSVDEALCFVT